MWRYKVHYMYGIQVPWGIRRTLKWLKDEYNDPAIIITENGISENGDSTELNDWWRKEYFVGYINEVYKGKLLFMKMLLLRLSL